MYLIRQLKFNLIAAATAAARGGSAGLTPPADLQ